MDAWVRYRAPRARSLIKLSCTLTVACIHRGARNRGGGVSKPSSPHAFRLFLRFTGCRNCRNSIQLQIVPLVLQERRWMVSNNVSCWTGFAHSHVARFRKVQQKSFTIARKARFKEQQRLAALGKTDDSTSSSTPTSDDDSTSDSTDPTATPTSALDATSTSVSTSLSASAGESKSAGESSRLGVLSRGGVEV